MYIKYNALVKRYNYRDEIDPISLNDIDECNEWLVGKMAIEEEKERKSIRIKSWRGKRE